MLHSAEEVQVSRDLEWENSKSSSSLVTTITSQGWNALTPLKNDDG